jgi:DNA-binding NarL/FixJ family response regulator
MDVVIADSRPEVRSALRVLLAEEPNVSVTAEAHDVPSLLAIAEVIRPAVVLLDWELADPRPDRVGCAVPADIARVAPSTRVIALSARIEAASEALGAGADAFVSKCDTPDRLLITLRNLNRED